MSKDVIEVDEVTGGVSIVATSKTSLVREKRELAKKARQERLADLEDELLDDAAKIMAGVHRFNEIEPDAKKPPQQWIDDLGEEEALKLFRVAKASWLGAKESPVALKLASATVQAVLKAKASRDHKEAPRFNVSIVQLPAPVKQEFPELEVEK